MQGPLLLLGHRQFALHYFAIYLVHPVLEQTVDCSRVFERNEAKAPRLQVSVNHYNTVIDLSILKEEALQRVLRRAC